MGCLAFLAHTCVLSTTGGVICLRLLVQCCLGDIEASFGSVLVAFCAQVLHFYRLQGPGMKTVLNQKSTSVEFLDEFFHILVQVAVIGELQEVVDVIQIHLS